MGVVKFSTLMMAPNIYFGNIQKDDCHNEQFTLLLNSRLWDLAW